MSKMITAILLLLCVVSGTGCAQIMAGCKHGPVDRTVLARGAHRATITDELGDGRGRLKKGAVTRTERYYYVDGGKKNTTWARTGRILLYTVGDVATVFLSQILFMPIETVLRGTQYRTRVDYQLYTDGTWRVADFDEDPQGKYKPRGLCD